MRLFGPARTASSEDLTFFLTTGIADGDPHDESVELCFGESVGPFQVDRILRRDDKKWRLERMGFSFDRNLAFLHSLEQGRLGFRCRAVDLVSQEELGKNRATAELEPRFTLIVQKAASDIAGKQVRRELNSLEGKVQRLTQETCDQRLRQPGIILDQDMPVGENAGEQLPQDIVFPDDNSRYR